jgi:rubrerythrin
MGMMLLKGNESLTDVISLAYGLEEGLRKFYSTAFKMADDPDVAALLSKLARIEDNHKQRLFDLYLSIDAGPSDLESFEANIDMELMEGGFHPDTLMKQSLASLSTPVGVINFAMMLEAQALDLYMRYADKSQDKQTEEMLFKMADEEKAHLKSLGELLEQKI